MSTSKSVGRVLTRVPAVPQAVALPALRRTSVPVHEPMAASRVAVGTQEDLPPSTQGTLALALVADPEKGGSPAANVADPGSRPAPLPIGLLPEPNAWAVTFIQAAIEVAGGIRSPGQLIRWTTPDVHSALVRRGALTARARRGVAMTGTKPRLRTIVNCSPRPGVCEVAAVINEADRVRAVAFRMEGLHGRWRVTQIEIG
jgi:Family of unknown function (DUF6459)